MYVSHRPNHQMELMGCIFSSFGEPGEWGPSIFGPSNVCDCLGATVVGQIVNGERKVREEKREGIDNV